MCYSEDLGSQMWLQCNVTRTSLREEKATLTISFLNPEYSFKGEKATLTISFLNPEYSFKGEKATIPIPSM